MHCSGVLRLWVWLACCGDGRCDGSLEIRAYVPKAGVLVLSCWAEILWKLAGFCLALCSVCMPDFSRQQQQPTRGSSLSLRPLSSFTPCPALPLADRHLQPVGRRTPHACSGKLLRPGACWRLVRKKIVAAVYVNQTNLGRSQSAEDVWNTSVKHSGLEITQENVLGQLMVQRGPGSCGRQYVFIITVVIVNFHCNSSLVPGGGWVAPGCTQCCCRPVLCRWLGKERYLQPVFIEFCACEPRALSCCASEARLVQSIKGVYMHLVLDAVPDTLSCRKVLSDYRQTSLIQVV